MTRYFKGHEHAAAYMVIDGNVTKLISYSTTVAELNHDWLTVHGLYSRTTIKHLGWFASELPLMPNGQKFTYYDLKYLYTHNISINIKTGEIR